jgi:uncharacterized membrane protein (DUF4010 family)
MESLTVVDQAGTLGILVAALGGAAIGIERQRSGHASGPHARFGGIRTFTLIGGVAGIAGWLTTLNQVGLAVVLTAAASALVVAGYVSASRGEIDATTEAAGLVVIGSGLVAGTGSLALASGIIAISTVLLIEKSRLHALVDRIDDAELRAAARFGVMAIVILPLLPEGPVAQLGGIRPRALWTLVLFFTGISFCGYLARRLFGAERGYPLAGLLGGLISSTSVTFTFARLSRQDAALSRPLAIGTLAACTVLFARVLIASSVLNPAVTRLLLPYLFPPLLVGVGALAIWWRGAAEGVPAPQPPDNPLQLVPALQMAALFQVVLFLVSAAGKAFGDSGLLFSGAVLGLTDVDALTLAMTTTSVGGAPAIAAKAIAVGIIANCLMKAALAIGLGTPEYRRIISGLLAAMAGVIGIAIAMS